MNGALAQAPREVVETDTGLKRLSDDYYVPFLSQNARERMPSPIRILFPLEAKPGLISFLLGKPNPAMFPFTSLNFTAHSPVDANEDVSYTLAPGELARALQYSATSGIKELRDWLLGLQEFSHGRKQGEGWDIFVGAGSQELLYKTIQALVDDTDPVLVESPIYPAVVPILHSLHCELIEIETDSQGMVATSLRTVLENWPAGKRRPRVLYTVPTGSNPTGTTAALERRKEILKLAREFDFLILEDDPYYYVYYGKEPRPPSYFSLEKGEPEVGRVLRFDSLSKVISAGVRIGFASGPERLLQILDRHTETLNLQTSTLTQVIVYKLLESWGYEGFQTHVERVSVFYREQRDLFQSAMKKYLDGYAEWTAPEAGMFFWFKLKSARDGEEIDSESIMHGCAFDRGVLALPGTSSVPGCSKTGYVRAAFGVHSAEEMNEGLRRLREAVIAYQ